MRMKGLMLAGASALALAACSAGQRPPSTMGGIAVKAGAAVDKAEQHYAEVAVVVDRVMPFLPERAADRLRSLQATIEGALLAARTATTVAGQAAALQEARSVTKQLADANATLSLPPPDPG